MGLLPRGAGGGSRTLTPRVGAADFKSAAYRQFRHPGNAQDSDGVYVPGVRLLTGNRSGPLPRNASRNFVNAVSSKVEQTATCPCPIPPDGAVHAVIATLLPSAGYGVPSMALGLSL